jgi:FTO catalytic domain
VKGFDANNSTRLDLTHTERIDGNTMGKRHRNNNKHDKRSKHDKHDSAKQQPNHKLQGVSQADSSANKPSVKAPPRFPLPFPSHLSVPSNDFLRSDSPQYKASFKAALETSYQGFETDPPEVFASLECDAALESLHAEAFFRTDITQPFGLGTPCASTYVTRCLLGDKGNTYRYLGLRMFAHPWDPDLVGKYYKSSQVQGAIHAIYKLNQKLQEQTRKHLSRLLMEGTTWISR